jgi:hypothetical protein
MGIKLLYKIPMLGNHHKQEHTPMVTRAVLRFIFTTLKYSKTLLLVSNHGSQNVGKNIQITDHRTISSLPVGSFMKTTSSLKVLK